MIDVKSTDGKRRHEMMFIGLNTQHIPQYPCWLHKDGESPLLVNNTLEADKARANGYDNITAAAMSNRYLINWFWDLEDMSAKQLHVFALEEYGIDLPIEAGQEKLFEAVCELTLHAPQNSNRLILMAHTVKMNYDETLNEIRRVIAAPGDANIETQSFEVFL
jgi:hypothetical protein